MTPTSIQTAAAKAMLARLTRPGWPLPYMPGNRRIETKETGQ